jgi:hypothetical protein
MKLFFDTLIAAIVLVLFGLLISQVSMILGVIFILMSIFTLIAEYRDRVLELEIYNDKSEPKSDEFKETPVDDKTPSYEEKTPLPEEIKWHLFGKKFYKKIKIKSDDFGINKLYHFTHKNNLDAITANGLYSWEYLEKNNTVSNFGGDDLSRKLDVRYNLENYVRLSFIPNHPMMYRKIKERGLSKNDFVILEIDISAAYLRENKYSDKNATDNSANIGDDFKSFDKINLKVIKDYIDGDTFYTNLDRSEQQFIQSEIMIKKHLPKEYILDVHTVYKIDNRFYEPLELL